MSVQASDLKYYLTVSGSGIVDGDSQENANDSLGGYRSSSEISSGVLNNLFDDVNSAEASAGDTEYRCIAIKNHAEETLYNAKVYIYSETDPNNDQGIEIAVETPETDSLTDGDAQDVADESTAPTTDTTDHNGTGSGVSAFSSPTISDNAITVDQGAHDEDMDAGELIFVWIKRTISSDADAQSNMSFTIRITGDTN